jgi:hypothetical protein
MREDHRMFFFSNRLGWAGSIAVSVLGTVAVFVLLNLVI